MDVGIELFPEMDKLGIPRVGDWIDIIGERTYTAIDDGVNIWIEAYQTMWLWADSVSR